MSKLPSVPALPAALAAGWLLVAGCSASAPHADDPSPPAPEPCTYEVPKSVTGLGFLQLDGVHADPRALSTRVRVGVETVGVLGPSAGMDLDFRSQTEETRVQIEGVEQRPVGPPAVRQWPREDQPGSPMRWALQLPDTALQPLVASLTHGLRCVEELPEAPPEGEELGLSPVALTLRGASGSRLTLRRRSAGGWVLGPSLGRPGVRLEDVGFGQALEDVVTLWMAPAREQWAAVDTPCPALVPSAPVTEVLMKTSYSFYRGVNRSAARLVRTGDTARFEASKGSGDKAQQWSGDLDPALLDSLGQAALTSLHCGAAAPDDDRPDRGHDGTVQITWGGGLTARALSTSQAPGGAPWTVTTRRGSELAQGAQDNGALGAARAAVWEAIGSPPKP